MQSDVNDELAEEFLDDYENDIPGTCVNLQIECLEDCSDSDDAITRYEITQEFLDDLSNEMTVDLSVNDIEARKLRSTEDGLGKIFLCY